MFNLEDFKKYGVAIRRDGKRVRFIVHITTARSDMHVISIDDDGYLLFNSEDGSFLTLEKKCDEDLVDVVRQMRNVSFSVPEPLSEEPEPGDVVYAVHGYFWEIHVIELVWGGAPLNAWGKNMLALFEMGLVYKTAEEAEAAADAIKKGFRR